MYHDIDACTMINNNKHGWWSMTVHDGIYNMISIGHSSQTRSQTVYEEKQRKEHEKEEMRCAMKKTDDIDYNFSFSSVDSPVSHESLQPDMDDQV